MLKTIKTQVTMLMLVLLVWSCTEDKGNYTYHEINELNATGIEEKYTVNPGGNLKIEPVVSATLDVGTNTNRYSYQWLALNAATLNTSAKTLIGTTKNFDGVIKLPPATYKVYYFIKDNVTGITWQQKPFELNVETVLSEGWLVVGDVNGVARLDMVSISSISGKDPVVIKDVLSSVGSGLQLKGKAVNVNFFVSPLTTPVGMHGIYVTASESGTSRLDPATFGWTQTQNMAYEFNVGGIPSNFAADFMKCPVSSGGENIVFSNGNIYYYNRAQSKKYGLPVNYVNGDSKTFVAAPFIAENGGSVGRAVFFDQVARRFVQFDYANGYCNPILNNQYINWTNTNSDLVFMTTINLYGTTCDAVAILKDITTGKCNLLKFNVRSDKTLIQQVPVDMTNATDINMATKFAVSPNPQYLFYVVGSKLYEFDWGTKSTKLMKDYGSEEITFIDVNLEASGFSNRLIVGSYNGTAGKMEVFTIPAANADFDPTKTVTYEGLCKIVDVAYRKR